MQNDNENIDTNFIGKGLCSTTLPNLLCFCASIAFALNNISTL